MLCPELQLLFLEYLDHLSKCLALGRTPKLVDINHQHIKIHIHLYPFSSGIVTVEQRPLYKLFGDLCHRLRRLFKSQKLPSHIIYLNRRHIQLHGPNS